MASSWATHLAGQQCTLPAFLPRSRASEYVGWDRDHVGGVAFPGAIEVEAVPGAGAGFFDKLFIHQDPLKVPDPALLSKEGRVHIRERPECFPIGGRPFRFRDYPIEDPGDLAPGAQMLVRLSIGLVQFCDGGGLGQVSHGLQKDRWVFRVPYRKFGYRIGIIDVHDSFAVSKRCLIFTCCLTWRTV